MQIESFQNFRKLWGVVNQDIEPGNYTFSIQNSKDIYFFLNISLEILDPIIIIIINSIIHLWIKEQLQKFYF